MTANLSSTIPNGHLVPSPPPRKACRVRCTSGLVYDSRPTTLEETLDLVDTVEQAMDAAYGPVLWFDAVGFEGPVRIRVSAIIAVEPVDVVDHPLRGRR